ncbi:oligosaccharyl transferase, archaeosortase A system-associated, partial [Methanocalculus sp.]|uniref:oligosaccharyl transferase, archaeosortase A system-associated n=1 Tax=Methanocalculus sp. TaxID=2004547 RepID=UPI002626A55B
CFIIALLKLKESGVTLSDLESLKNPVLIYPALAGFAFLLGFYNMTTMVMFGFIVAVYTLVQMILDHIRKQQSDYLVLTNCVTFLVVILGIIPFGLKLPGFSVGSYSPGSIIVYSLIIIGTLLLYGISRYLADHPWYYYPGALAGVSIGSFILGLLVLPTLVGGYISQFTAVFGLQAVVLTVQEAMPWRLEMAVSTFSWGWILVAGGVVYLLYRIWKQNDAPALFTLIWFILIFLATTRQLRFEYYLASNIALMAALAVGGAMQFGGRDLLRLTGIERFLAPKEQAVSPEPSPEVLEDVGQKGKKQKKPQKKVTKVESPSPARSGLLVVTVALALLFGWSGLSANIALGSHLDGGMNADWKAALQWLGENSPDPGVDYYEIFDTPQMRGVYEYPPEAYGVLSWWDYGHWITFVSKRIPHANPFQRGATTSAQLFMETDGDAATVMLEELGIRYIITDIEMTTGKFWAMATWFDPVNATDHFQTVMLYQESQDSQMLTPVNLYRQSYYQTMIQRLHVFDGSARDPGEVWVITSIPASLAGVTGSPYPVIAGGETFASAVEAQAYIEEYKMSAPAGHRADILSPEMFIPSTELDALRHIRLVYESPTNMVSDGGDIRYVKIFEVVPGATVQGDGMIEVPIKTNTGRTFTYRQESRDGFFVLPYPTEAGPDDVVVATGPYRIVETGQEISVPYQAVMEGLRI